MQLIGGIVLHQGKIAEMRTGEGKTLTATLPVALNALEGKGVHLVTVNDYLAKRDTQWMGPIYDELGLSVALIQHERSVHVRSGMEAEDERLAHLRPITRQKPTPPTSPTAPTTSSDSTTCATTWCVSATNGPARL